MRYLIIAINYFPEVTACAPYTTDMAEHLAAEGHTVSVLTTMPHYPEWRVASEYKNADSHTEILNGVTVRRIRTYIPSAMNALTRGRYELEFLLRGLWATRNQRVDCLIAVSPSWSDMAIAAIRRRTETHFKVLVQDLMAAAAEQSGMSGGRAVASIVAQLEGWCLRRADSIGLISESFRDRVLDFGVNPNVLSFTPNYPQSHVTPVDVREARAILGWPEDKYIVVHTGNMGLKQDLPAVLDSAEVLEKSEPNVSFYLIGDGSQKPFLAERAASQTNVHFLPLVDDATYSTVLGAADALLVNESPRQVDMSVPSKLTSYEAARRPIIVRTSFEGATRRAITDSQSCLWIDAADSNSLVDLLQNRDRLRALVVQPRTTSPDARRGVRMDWALTAKFGNQ